MQIDHPQHYNGTVDVQFSITFTKVVPSLAGTVTACKTIKGYQQQIPFVNRIYAHTCGSSYTARVLPSSPARTGNNYYLKQKPIIIGNLYRVA